jgi:hypothetical protein
MSEAVKKANAYWVSYNPGHQNYTANFMHRDGQGPISWIGIGRILHKSD